MNKPFTFEKLQEVAGNVLSDLINTGEIELRSQPADLANGQQEVTPAMVEQSIDEAVQAAYGIAEHFLNVGHQRFGGLPSEPAQSTESEATEEPGEGGTPKVGAPKIKPQS